MRKTINAMLDEEIEDLVGAKRYESTDGLDAYRFGHYRRKLTTTSDEIKLECA